MDDVQAAWSSLSLAFIGVGVLVVPALGAVGVSVLRSWQRANEKRAELTERDLELKRLEVEEKIGTIRRRIALDAVAIAEEQGRDQNLSGPAKAVIAAAKVEELLSASAAPNVEGSQLTDLVKLGVAQLRQTGATTFLVTPSKAPPPDRVVLPKRLPAPAAVPAVTPATKTSPERPGAKR